MVPVGWCEREGELARVDALLAAARASRGGVLLITGPAGIGKTVLLGAARERASQAGMRVLTGRGGELESGFSFGVARQLFEPLLAGAGAAERDAVLGDGAQLRHAAALAGMGLADAAAAADGLAGIGVFEPGTPLRFAHPIVRTAVHEDIPQADRGPPVMPRRRGCWPPRARTWMRCARTCWCASRPGRLRWWSVCGRPRRGLLCVARPRARLPICAGRWRRQPM